MKLKLHPKLIFRTPTFSYNVQLNQVWTELKQAISISSEVFYDTIKDVEVDDLHSLAPKVKFTIWKYFNRAKYRATPYGTFAGFSLLENDSNCIADKIEVSKNFKLHEFANWPEKNNIKFDFKGILNDDLILFSNSSFYKIGTSIRYIACTNGQFELAEIDFDVFIFSILEKCTAKITLGDLKVKLGIEHEEFESFYDFLADLHEVQLLFHNYDENIIGDDYFKRINYKDAGVAKYIIAEREIFSGKLGYDSLRNLPELIHVLSDIAPNSEQKTLQEFVNKFKIRFEQKELPLLQVLDPETGIGYGQLEQADLSDDFITQFVNKKSTVNGEDKFKSIKNFIKHNISSLGREAIYLDQFKAETNKKTVLPNTFSAILSVVDDNIIVNQIAGVTANALNGRFTLANEKVSEYCKDLTEIEKNANPEVLFFDVAYLVETNVDNINRRNSIYDYQLSILNFDCSKEPLLLNDIMVSVRGNDAILWSIKYNKRLIPRIASAYNYGRSDLSVFRLLCDLQHQGLKSNLSFSLDKILPNENFYPRVQYKNLIISMAKWLVLPSVFLKKSIDDCRNYLQSKGVSNVFKAGISDQTLVFNLNSDDDLDAFNKFSVGKDELWLEEVILPNESLIVDEFSNPYLAEFVLSITHNEEIYKGVTVSSGNCSNTQKTVFYPGSEWLYFEVYCHQQRSDYLLANHFNAFVNQYTDKIDSWFFIRYNENGDHLRLRFLLKDKIDTQLLMSAFTECLEEELSDGIVSEIIVKTYKQEAERYGFDLIEEAEGVFYKDSLYVVNLLQHNYDFYTLYALVGDVIKKLLTAEVFKFDELKRIVNLISDSFNSEHKLESLDFKKLNSQYQLFKNTNQIDLEPEQNSCFENYMNALILLLKRCNEERRGKLFTDMIHMHVNRIFNKDQRAHEMVMYYFLLKDLNKMQALEKLNFNLIR